jgi:ribosome-binding factor A
MLQKELGDIYQREGRNMFSGKMITVTEVRITSDLGLARVYLSVFPLPSKKDFSRVTDENAGRVRRELGNRIRHQLRSVPELRFILDDSLDYMENIDRLLNQ